MIKWEDLADAGMPIGSSIAYPSDAEMSDIDYAFYEEVFYALYGEYGKAIREAVIPLSYKISISEDKFAYAADLEIHDLCTSNDSIRSFMFQVIKNYYLAKGVYEGDLYLVDLALSLGASPNQRCNYRKRRITPIVQSAITGDIEICESLCKHGADVNLSQANSETALANAANRGYYEIVNLLLQKGADPNAETYAGTALALASNIAIILLLSAYGADPNIPDEKGDLPIMGYIDQREYQAVYLLRLLGTDLHFCNRQNETPVDRATRSNSATSIKILTQDTPYSEPLPPANLDTIRNCILNQIEKLRNQGYPPNVFMTTQVPEYQNMITKQQKENMRSIFRIMDEAIAAKRAGNLEHANRLYCSTLAFDNVFHSDVQWGWFKVLLLAKKF